MQNNNKLDEWLTTVFFFLTQMYEVMDKLLWNVIPFYMT